MTALDAFLGDRGRMPSAPLAATFPPVALETLRALAEAPRPDHLVQRVVAYADGSRNAESTDVTRRYQGFFETALRKHGLDPYACHVAAIGAFLEGQRYYYTAATRQAQVAAIRDAYLERGLPDPTQHDIVRDKLASLERQSLTRNLAIRPLLIADYLKLRSSIPRDVRGLRDRCAIGIGFEGFLFSGPVAALNVTDITIDTEGATLHLPSKTRSVVYIPRRGNADAVTDLADYLAITGLTGGPLFRRVNSLDQLARDRLTRHAICRHCFRSRLEYAGFDGRAYRYSSLRAGHLISAELLGVDELQLTTRAGIRSGTTTRKWRGRARTHRV